MITKKVLKTEDISLIPDGRFIYCKELKKGIVKRDLTALNITDYSFQNVTNVIESMDKDFLVQNGLDSVLFGANLTPDQGKIIKSDRTVKIIQAFVDDNKLSGNEFQIYINQMSNMTYIMDIEEAVVFDITNVIKIKAPDGVANDYFGWSVSASESRIVVGAYGDDDNGSYSGSAYIYDTDGNFISKITAPDGFTSDQFGKSVSASESRIVVGAYGDDDKGNSSGSTYIYDTNGNFISKITAPDGASSNQFGYSVSASESRIVVGAYRDDDNGTYSGSAYIYDINGNFISKLVASDGAAIDYFGFSVSASDTRIVVGAYRDDDKGTDSGSAYIYDVDGNFISKITAPDGLANDYFGYSVSASDTRVVVGAYQDDDKGTDSGSAYIYDTDGTFISKITAPDGAASDYFGNSVSATESRIVVGTYYADDNGSNSGSAYIYDTNGNFIQKITAPDGAASDYFGISVSTSDTRIVVGAYGDDDKGSVSGSAYIFG